MARILETFWKDQSAGVAVEYLVLAAVMGIGFIAIVASLSDAISGTFNAVATKVAGSE